MTLASVTPTSARRTSIWIDQSGRRLRRTGPCGIYGRTEVRGRMRHRLRRRAHAEGHGHRKGVIVKREGIGSSATRRRRTRFVDYDWLFVTEMRRIGVKWDKPNSRVTSRHICVKDRLSVERPRSADMFAPALRGKMPASCAALTGHRQGPICARTTRRFASGVRGTRIEPARG